MSLSNIDRAETGARAVDMPVKSRQRWLGPVAIILMAGTLVGCSNVAGWFSPAGSWLPSTGPSTSQIKDKAATASSPIPIIDLNDSLARQQQALQRRSGFSQTFSNKFSAPVYVLGPGDTVEVSVWEAPPAVLFGSSMIGSRGTENSKAVSLPEQMISADGTITIPFVGPVMAAGRTPQRVEEVIRQDLRGKANNPQVLVRVTQNVTANVTVVGDVGKSSRLPLTAKGERLLDALAASGGTSQAIDKTMIQLSRGGVTAAMPLNTVIREPDQNVLLMPGDVVTALFQTNSFVSLGATGSNKEISFEAQGINLAQALGRIGGLLPNQADPEGVFIFRFETPAALPGDLSKKPRTQDGRIPVIYRVDLKNPVTFLAAQNFPVQDKDVVYVSTAPAAEMQMFLNIITSSVYSTATIANINN